MVPNACGAIWCTTADQTFWADPVACDLLGIPATGPLADSRIAGLLSEVTAPPGAPPRYYTFRNAESHVLRARLVPSAGDSTVILIDDLKDITERVFQLKGSEREYRELFDNAPYGIYRSSTTGSLIQVNPALARLHGYRSAAALLKGMKAHGHQPYVDSGRSRQFFDHLQRDGRVVDFVSEVIRHKTGERIWISETAWLVRDTAGAPRYMAGTVVDITERMRHLEQVKRAAATDALTGLANRAALHVELERRIAEPGSAGLTLFLIDCDRFKDINDVYGHARGDAVLRIIADRLRQVAPASGVIARLGGDEFAVLTTNLPDGASAIKLGEHLCATFRMPVEIGGASHQLGASIGIARYPDHAATASDLLRNADLALYSVKDKGRGHARLFDSELDREKRARHAMAQDMRGADGRGEFELFYQPVVDGNTLSTVGLEALIRWRHPERGLVSPGEFIPVAEDEGLMLPFGEWAIHEACRHAGALPRHVKVAVNVSALQFRSSSLSQVVAAALALNGLEANRIELEVTESMVLKNEFATIEALERLRTLGVGIVLDDFGTGYSTLGYLQQFRFDKVKIDPTFVRSMRTNSVNRAVIRAVLSIGRDLGLAVVAEGIESEAERQALLAEGCLLMQGYLFGAPQPYTDAVARLALEGLPSGRAQRRQKVKTA